MLADPLGLFVRSVMRRPRMTLPTLLSMALGIGASTTVFAVVKGVLLVPLPYPEAERLVLLRARNLRTGETRPFGSYPDFLDWRESARSFEAMALYQWRQIDLPNEGGTERVQGLRVTPEYFRLLGLSAAVGPLPTESSTDAIVLSRGLWVMNRNVALRRGELGVRLALGARAGQIVGMILVQSLIVTAAGLAVGFLAVASGTKLISSLLYGVAPTDLTIVLFPTTGTIAACTLASLLPARSAARTDPLRMLRLD